MKIFIIRKNKNKLKLKKKENCKIFEFRSNKYYFPFVDSFYEKENISIVKTHLFLNRKMLYSKRR